MLSLSLPQSAVLSPFGERWPPQSIAHNSPKAVVCSCQHGSEGLADSPFIYHCW